jgi:hypothetical protein
MRLAAGSSRFCDGQFLHRPRENVMDGRRINDLLVRVTGEFREMPGLRLTPAQAQRLWSVDRSTCEDVLNALVDAEVLSSRPDGTFALKSSAP